MCSSRCLEKMASSSNNSPRESNHNYLLNFIAGEAVGMCTQIRVDTLLTDSVANTVAQSKPCPVFLNHFLTLILLTYINMASPVHECLQQCASFSHSPVKQQGVSLSCINKLAGRAHTHRFPLSYFCSPIDGGRTYRPQATRRRQTKSPQ